MASIKKRKTAGGEWCYDVRYRVGRRAVLKTFRRRVDADNYRRQVEHDELHGTGIDPRAARITLGEWWERWWPSTAHLRACGVSKLRQECLDWTLIHGHRHLQTVLDEYVEHYNRHRSHRGLDLTPPDPTPRVRATTGPVIRRPRLDGLINEYQRRAA